MSEDYVLITVAKQNFTWEARILSRGMPYLQVIASLPNRLKAKNTRISVGDICEVDMRDADSGEGTADILELIESKDVRKLRHKGLIPEEEEYAYLLVSDKKLGYTGGAFPYKAKLSGLGASTLPEDPDVIARANYAARKERREARRAAGFAESGGTTPATTPPILPSAPPGEVSEMEGMPSPMEALPTTGADANPEVSVTSAPSDGGEPILNGHEHEGGEDEDLDNLVNPNHRWADHDGGVTKGYVSKRERRDLAMETRLKKRAEPAPKHSPSLIPQMAALDRVGGDAELDDI